MVTIKELNTTIKVMNVMLELPGTDYNRPAYKNMIEMLESMKAHIMSNTSKSVIDPAQLSIYEISEEF